MLIDFDKVMSAVAVAAIAGAAVLSGCSDDAAAPTAATPNVDAGCPGAGCPAMDAGCPGQEAGCPGAAATPGDAQTPPTGDVAAIEAWIAAGSYKAWKCEPAARPAMAGSSGVPGSPHGSARVCSNGLLSESTAAEFPVGAAGVKEIYENGAITGYAFYLKREAGKKGAGWYWYERLGTQQVANGLGVALCTGCHDSAPKDSVFVQVK